MTPQDHNKVIGIMHLIWGGFNALMMFIIVPFMLMFGFMGRDPNPSPEVRAMLGFVALLAVIFALAFSIPPLLAGYGMLKRKKWGRAAGIVAAAFSALSIPFGAALTVYTLWFLCGQQGTEFYKQAAYEQEPWRGSLRDAHSFDWEAQRTADSARRRDYAPPQQPPDWRS